MKSDNLSTKSNFKGKLMGIMMSRDLDNNSELNRRIASDLRERTQSSTRRDPDFEEDSAYVEGTKKTGHFGWIWIVLIVLAIISLICIIFI